LSAASDVIPLLQFYVMAGIPFVPTPYIKIDVAAWYIVILAKSELINKTRGIVYLR